MLNRARKTLVSLKMETETGPAAAAAAETVHVVAHAHAQKEERAFYPTPSGLPVLVFVVSNGDQKNIVVRERDGLCGNSTVHGPRSTVHGPRSTVQRWKTETQ
jgi:hypothetical protein